MDMPASCALIVNADDLGWMPGRDRGILRAIDEGIVTSASILANGTTFAAAASQARERRAGIGVHLNLSEGKALGGVVDGLTDAAGNFPGKSRARSIFAQGAFDRPAALRELGLQVEAVLDAGIVPDHVDTHQHMGVFPSTLPLMVEICRLYGIDSMRLSLPAEAGEHDPDGVLGEELQLYRRFGPFMSDSLRRAGLLFPAGLWGMPLLNRLDTAALLSLLEQIPHGCWELMVHPGAEDRGMPFCGPERALEQEALICAAVRDLVHSRNIHLITFGDLHAYSYLLA